MKRPIPIHADCVRAVSIPIARDFVLTEPSFTNPTDNSQVILPRVFLESSTGGPSTVGLSSAENPNFRTPSNFQYNFTIEREQWNTGFRLSYIGTAMRQ